MFEPAIKNNDAIIKVIGVGGGGGNAVEHMVKEHIEGVEFLAVNTDVQALRKIEVGKTIQIGNNITKGLGAGANPKIGKNAAEEDKENLKLVLDGADMVFIASGMGGGTGTGAAPVIAEITKDLGILTVAVVTKPFNFEGKKRMVYANQGITELSKHVDSLIIIPNDKLLQVLSKGISLLDAFSSANNILKGAVQGIADLITKPGLINVDFADIRTVMSEMGYAMMGTGISSGENRAKEATEISISSPLLEDVNLSGAQGILVNITSGFNMKLDEFETVGNIIRSFSSDNATVVIGTSLDIEMNDTLRVTVVATGIEINKKSEKLQHWENTKFNKIPFNFTKNNNVILHKSESMTHNENEKIKKKLLLKENSTNYLDIPAFLRKKSK
ncbi:cell division protein FtsZ [Buchnera aphidicola (Schlechtendalia chinensis)]|uniref:Cell division protein FtsZ n=1 Tax=Buchnera aphidicola subsp. Schlechtendalia chinensis TaxID=118110 RepID=A0A172WDI6_BUCSC|nr:cell division protein FtsZ [Buchnera aphidicola]ANF16997.1 cell division protein FtsZ [Buchnera aphidicola (Schlechtendalia chinensis)]